MVDLSPFFFLGMGNFFESRRFALSVPPLEEKENVRARDRKRESEFTLFFFEDCVWCFWRNGRVMF